MASFRITNERGEPLIGVVVEARAISGQILERQSTGMDGIVKFSSGLPATGWSPKASITRYSGMSGGMSLNGEINIQPYNTTEPELPKLPETPKPVNPTLPDKTTSSEGLTKLPSGILKWDTDGIVKYWTGTTWKELGPELPTADPGNGELWLECPP